MVLRRQRLGILVVSSALGALAAGQETAPKPELPLELFPADDPRNEIIRLFHQVEQELQAIDVELLDASAGRTALSEVGDGGIEKLLRSSRAKSDEVVSGIDKILELAAQLQGGGTCMSQGMSPSSAKQGESPLDQARDQGPTQREKTPEGPGEKPGQKDPGQEQPDGSQPQANAKPDGPLPNPPDGENRPGDPRVDEAGQPVTPGTDADRWGFLPERVRETFRNQGADDLPVQYRDWIDSYYRRLNQGR